MRLRTAGLRAQILVIAVLMKGVLRRTFNVFQWEALLLLVAGITVNQLNYCTCAIDCMCTHSLCFAWLGCGRALLKRVSSWKGCATDSLVLA